MTKIRVLVVEDSLTIRKRMLEVLAADPDIDIVGEADDGKRGIELCQQLRPDVVTLDMMLPVMNGLTATEFIMAYCPTPILIVSASTNRGDLFKTFDALAAGALDALDKPMGNEVDGVCGSKNSSPRSNSFRASGSLHIHGPDWATWGSRQFPSRMPI